MLEAVAAEGVEPWRRAGLQDLDSLARMRLRHALQTATGKQARCDESQRAPRWPRCLVSRVADRVHIASIQFQEEFYWQGINSAELTASTGLQSTPPTRRS